MKARGHRIGHQRDAAWSLIYHPIQKLVRRGSAQSRAESPQIHHQRRGDMRVRTRRRIPESEQEVGAQRDQVQPLRMIGKIISPHV